MIEEVRCKAAAPRVHEVLLTNDVNAAVVQVPRLGMFGWQKNYPILGLPLMQLMSPEELKAVLATSSGTFRARNTSTADTHPCLRDRLAALNVAANVPEPIGRSAADELFGGKLATLIEHFDTEWRSATEAWWRGRHAHMRNGREKLTALAQRPTAEMTDVELYEYAAAVEEFDDADKAFELYETLVLERGARRGAKFAYARLLLRGDESAIGMLDEVMSEMPEATLSGCALIVDYLLAHGRETEAKPYIQRYHERREAEAQARAARETLLVKDTYLPHTLGEGSLASLKATLTRHADVKAAYLVRKRTPENTPPLHVVGVLRRTHALKVDGSTANHELIQRLARDTEVPEELLFIWLNGKQKSFRRAFEKVAGSRIV